MNRPRYISILHAIGVGLSILAVIIGGPYNVGIIFPIAVAILMAFEVPTPKEKTSKEILRIIYGSITKGGIRRGIFIKEMFTVAVLYLAITTYIFFGNVSGAVSNGILGIALIISDIASEIEARIIKEVIAE